MSMEISSSAFAEGATIPLQYTCEGKDLSPPLSLSGVPEQARSLALIVDDPDAPRGDFVHWVVFDIPGGTRSFAEGKVPAGAHQGRNDAGTMSWTGPCPPPGKPHRYFFKAFALDAEPKLPAGASKQQLLSAMEGHILAEAQLMATFARGS